MSTTTMETSPTTHVQKHRDACDACHTRKIRCPATGPGACSNCQNTGRICIFSPRDEMGRPRKGSSREERKQKRKKSAIATRASTPKEQPEPQRYPDPEQETSQQPQQLGSPSSDMLSTGASTYDLPMLDDLNEYTFEWNDAGNLPTVLDFNFDRPSLPLSPAPTSYLTPPQRSPSKLQRPTPEPLQRPQHSNYSVDPNATSRSFDMPTPQSATHSFHFSDPSKTYMMNQQKPHSYTQAQTLPRLQTSHGHTNSWGPSSSQSSMSSASIYRTLSQILHSLRLEHGQAWSGMSSNTADMRRETLFATVSTLCDVVPSVLTPSHSNTLSSIAEHPADPSPATMLTGTAISMVLTIYRALATSMSSPLSTKPHTRGGGPSSSAALHHPSPCPSSTSSTDQLSPINLDVDPSLPSPPSQQQQQQSYAAAGSGALANAIHLTTMDFHLAKLQRVVCEAEEASYGGVGMDGTREIGEVRMLLQHLGENIKGTF